MALSDWSRRVGSIEFSPHPRAFVLIFYRIPVNLVSQLETKLDGADAWHQWRRESRSPASNFPAVMKHGGKLKRHRIHLSINRAYDILVRVSMLENFINENELTLGDRNRNIDSNVM